MATIEARGLRKTYGTTIAIDSIDLRVEEGRILGIIGPNGAGKTTALNAILGLTSYEGQLNVLGRDPWNARDELMRDVSFIADVAVLPRWIRVTQLLDYVAGVHPRFDRTKAEEFLARTTINARARSGNYRRAWWRNCISHSSWRLTRNCWCSTSRRLVSTSYIASSSTIAVERLFRQDPHHRGDDASGRRDPGRPNRSHVHRSRPDRARVQHGRIRVAISRSDGESRATSPQQARSSRFTNDRSSAAA